MPALNSPFQCGGATKTFPAIPRNFKLVLRLEDVSGAYLYIKKNGDPTIGQDYILYPKDALEIFDRGEPVVSVVNGGTGDPNVYWSMEHQ